MFPGRAAAHSAAAQTRDRMRLRVRHIPSHARRSERSRTSGAPLRAKRRIARQDARKRALAAAPHPGNRRSRARKSTSQVRGHHERRLECELARPGANTRRDVRLRQLRTRRHARLGRLCVINWRELYSITSSPSAGSLSGTARPRVLAVVRLMISSNLVA